MSLFILYPGVQDWTSSNTRSILLTHMCLLTLYHTSHNILSPGFYLRRYSDQPPYPCLLSPELHLHLQKVHILSPTPIKFVYQNQDYIKVVETLTHTFRPFVNLFNDATQITENRKYQSVYNVGTGTYVSVNRSKETGPCQRFIY